MTAFYPSQGGLGAIQSISAGLAAITSGNFSAAAANMYDWGTLKYPLALVFISIPTGWSGTPTVPCVVEVWGLQKNIGGVSGNNATDAPATSVNGGAIWLGKIDIAGVNAAQKRGCLIRLDSDMTIYLKNRTDKDIASGTVVDMWPLSYGINA